MSDRDLLAQRFETHREHLRAVALRMDEALLADSVGLAGAVWSVGGRPQVVFGFTVRGGRVVGIELLGDPETLDVLHLEPMEE